MKKLTSLILVIVLCLSLSPAVFAVYTYEESRGEIDTDDLLSCLESIICDADIWGLEGKLDSLYVGEPVHTYEYLNTGALSKTDFVYYPVFSDGIPLLLVLEDEDGFSQITQAFIGTLSDYIDESVAIIYDQDEAYVLSASGKASIAYEYEVSSDERGDITDMSEISQCGAIKWAALSACQALPSLEYAAQPCYDPNFPNVSLNVPKVLQGKYTELCTVACISSVSEYLTGISYTIEELVTIQKGYGGIHLEEAVSLQVGITWLSEVYGVQYRAEVTQNPPYIGDLYKNLSAGYPLIGRWDGGSWNHATVIRGISVVSDSVTMMDPEVGYVTVKTRGSWIDYTTQKTYSTYVYTSPANGQTGYLTGFASKY